MQSNSVTMLDWSPRGDKKGEDQKPPQTTRTLSTSQTDWTKPSAPATGRKRSSLSLEGEPLSHRTRNYMFCVRSAATYLVRFGLSRALLLEKDDGVLFELLAPLIASDDETQVGLSSMTDVFDFLDSLTPTPFGFSALVTSRLQQATSSLTLRLDKAFLRGLGGVSVAGSTPPPVGFSREDWVLTNGLFLINFIGKIYRVVELNCTIKNCPEMDVSDDIFYKWKDESFGTHEGLIVSASEYIRNLFRWFEGKLARPIISKGLLQNKSNYVDYHNASEGLSCSIFKKLLRILAHIQFKHLSEEKLRTTIPPGRTYQSDDLKRNPSMAIRGNPLKDFEKKESFDDALRNVQKEPKTSRKKTRSGNIPLPLFELTEYLSSEEMKLSLKIDVRKYQRQANRLLKQYQKNEFPDLVGVKPAVILSAIALFLSQMNDPLIPSEYHECLSVTLTLATRDIRMTCLKRTIGLIEGKSKEILIFTFNFFHFLSKILDIYDISTFFGPRILRPAEKNPFLAPKGYEGPKLTETLATALVSLILSDFHFFFPPPVVKVLTQKSKNLAQARLPSYGAVNYKREKGSRDLLNLDSDEDVSRVRPKLDRTPKVSAMRTESAPLSSQAETKPKLTRSSLRSEANRKFESSERIDTSSAKSGGRKSDLTEDDLISEEEDAFGTFVVKKSEKKKAPPPEENFGTFVINEKPTQKATQKLKDRGERTSGSENSGDEQFGTFVIHEKSKAKNSGGESPSNPFGTFVIKSEESEEEERKGEEAFGTFVVDDSDAARSVADEVVSSLIESVDPNSSSSELKVGYREPDKWEKNLVSLTKGEWGEEMEDAAFHRYKKSRRGIGDMKWSTKENSKKKKNVEHLQRQLGVGEVNAMCSFAASFKRASMLVDFEQLSHDLSSLNEEDI